MPVRQSVDFHSFHSYHFGSKKNPEMDIQSDAHASSSTLVVVIKYVGGLLLFLLMLWSNGKKTSARLPPGPRPLPVLGNILSLDSLPHRTFSKWAQQFGKIFTCYFGPHTVIVLNDAELIREAMWMHEFSGRPDLYTAQVTSGGHGIICASDETWELHRKFFKTTLKSLCSKRNLVLQRVNEECDNLIRMFQETNGKPFSCDQPIQTAVGNVIFSVLFGQLLEQSGVDIMEFSKEQRVVSSWFALVGALNVFPILRFVPSVNKGWNIVLNSLERCANFIKVIIKQHEENPASDEIADFTDSLITARNEEIRRNDRQIISQLREMFTVANDTTAASLRWAVLYIATNPEIQAKVHQELDKVVGTSRNVAYEDAEELPYIQAVLNECARMSSVAPIAVPHRASRDLVFHGYLIPKNAWIVPNLAHVHWDPEIWGDPEVFRPERFLTQTGELLTPKEFFPFGVGKRVCLGESVAKMELFVMFSRILQNFRLEAVGEIDLTPLNGPALEPKPFQIVCSNRFAHQPNTNF